jgi:hypothetical protein
MLANDASWDSAFPLAGQGRLLQPRSISGPYSRSLLFRPTNSLSTLRNGRYRTFNLMAQYVGHLEEKVSQEAVVGVLYSQHFSSASDSIKDMLVSAGSGLARKAYVGRIAKAEFKGFAEILLDDAASNYVDFAEPISNARLAKMARKSFQNHRLRGISAKQVVSQLVDRSAPLLHADEDDPARRALMIKTLLAVIGRKYRIPFRLENDWIPGLSEEDKQPWSRPSWAWPESLLQ